MTISVSTMFIPVHDPDEALGFYRDALGLEVRNDVSKGEFRWVTVGAPGQPVDIVLSQPHGGRSEADGDALLGLVLILIGDQPLFQALAVAARGHQDDIGNAQSPHPTQGRHTEYARPQVCHRRAQGFRA